MLGVVRLVLAFHSEADVVVMIAHRNREDFLGFVLLDDEAVEVIFDVARLFIEAEFAWFRGLGGGRWFGRLGASLRAEKGSGVREMLAHEVGHLALKIFG